MPVLRMEPDNTLAETLGNLGNSLTTAFNPLNQIRAGNLQSEIQQRNWELQHAQSIDAANRNAANVFYNSDLPFDPATKEMIAAGLRSGTLGVNNYIDALTKTGNLKAAQTASTMYAAAHPELPADELASDQAQLLSGQKTASELDAQRATTALTTLKTTQTQGGVASAQTPAAKEAMALGQPDVGVQLDTAEKLRTAPPITGALSDPATQAAIDQRVIERGQAKIPVTADMPVSSGEASNVISRSEAQAGETARQQKVGEQIGGGIAPTGTFFPFGLPGSPSNPFGSPPAAPDTAAPPAPPVTIPNAASPSATPTPVVRPEPTAAAPAAVVVGESAPEAAQRTAIDTNTRAQLQEAVDAGVAGKKMLAVLDRLNTLATLAGTSGSSQIPTWVDTWLRDHGLVMTNRQGILAAMQAEFNAQIPELRKDMGVKFEAGPELSAQAKLIGNPSLPAEVLKGIFARQASVANLAIQKRELAMRALYPGQDKPLALPDYYKQAAQIDDSATAEMQQQIKDFGGITPQSVAPPPVPQATSSNSMLDAFQKTLDWLRGGSQTQTPQTPPQPQPTEQYDVDKNGNVIRVR